MSSVIDRGQGVGCTTTEPGQRHREFVSQHGAKWGLAVLVAPLEWIRVHQGEVDEYQVVVCLEEVAGWCRDRGLKFSASVFEQACKPPSVDLAPDIQDWHAHVHQLLLEAFDIRLQPQLFVRTRNKGRAKPNRWPVCEMATLEPAPTRQHPQIWLKPASANHTSRVVIEIPKASAELVQLVADAVGAERYRIRLTTARTLMVVNEVPEAQPWALSSPFEEQVPYLLVMGRAVAQLRDWWNSLVRSQNESTPESTSL